MLGGYYCFSMEWYRDKLCFWKELIGMGRKLE